MTKITITSDDADLIREIWSLKTSEIDFSQPIEKAIPETVAYITLYITVGKQVLDFVDALLTLIKKHTKGEKGKTKTKIHTSESITEMRKLLAKYDEAVSASVEEGDDDSEEADDLSEA